MTDDPKNLSCAEFQAQLPDLISSGDDVRLHPHIQSCELCRALFDELETIAEAARQLFPTVEPPDKLWEQIESAILNEDGGAKSESAKSEPGPAKV